MAGYRVIHTFVDLCDKHYIYRPGDVFPRDGIDVSADRIAELASEKNKIGKPVIEEVPGEKKMPYEKPMIIEVPAAASVGDPDSSVPVETPKKRGRKKKNAD